MLVLKLCQQFCPEKLTFPLSHRLGDGADGEVFELKDEPNKVIKFCVLYESSGIDIKGCYAKTSKTLSYIKYNQPQTYARVYDYMYLGEYSRSIERSKNQNYILYYYVMEKLYKLSEDEKKVFHSIICHEDRNKVKNFSISKIKDMLKGMGQALDFDEGRVMFFYENLKKTPLHHQDVHVRNIMKDVGGNFKLIDFDRCELTH
jgi:hypothetical protein